jgi:transcriptional regulator with XRE-family HTH domain
MDRPELVAAHLARNLVALRHVRNLTQGALAKAAGVPRSTISNLESSSGNPSLTVLVKVASALGVPLDELLASPRAKVRKWTRDELASPERGRGVTIANADSGARARGVAQRDGVRAGRVDARLAALPGTREFFTCLAGAVTIFVAGERFDLAVGDVLAFPGNVPHSYKNPDASRAAHGVSAVILAKTGI